MQDRKQYVSFDNQNSSLQSISTGVPQGSILGPLLFLLYVNDMQFVSQVLCPIIFADDTTLFVRGSSVVQLTTILREELPKINEWFAVNKLLVNMNKTNYMIFKPKNKDINPNILEKRQHFYHSY